jgi:DNA repair exonuclease SbcCD ATPase subunit
VPEDRHPPSGVYISDKEMYEILLTTKENVSSIRDKISKIERIDERSREALEVARAADRKADEARSESREAHGRLDKINQYVLFAFIGGSIGLLFYLARVGVIGG